MGRGALKENPMPQGSILADKGLRNRQPLFSLCNVPLAERTQSQGKTHQENQEVLQLRHELANTKVKLDQSMEQVLEYKKNYKKMLEACKRTEQHAKAEQEEKKSLCHSLAVS